MEGMSRKKLSEFMMIIIMIIMKMGINECCIESERNGLLEIKSSFNFSWGNQSDDCCNWENVECNSTTGHITTLYLGSIREVDSEENWYLNASLFLPFQQLNKLNLYRNNIAGCIQNQGFERLSALANLEILGLSYNKFNNTILRSLSGLHSLKSLYLRGNNLKGTIDISELSSQTSTLEELDFSDNEIEGFEMMEGFERLSTHTNLEILDLSGNKFNNATLCSLSGLQALKSLHLSENKLKGTIDISELSNLTSTLEELNLSENEIEGFESTEGFERLPVLANLEILYLGGNKFNNTILRSLNCLHSLKSLYLDNNNMKGTIDISETELSYLTSALEELNLSYNEIEVFESTEGSERLSKLANLKILNLSGNKFNNTILRSLNCLHSLKSLDLGGNNLKGIIDISEWSNLTSALEELDFSLNEIEGFERMEELDGLTNLQELDLSSNKITNLIASAGFKKLETLDMANNQFNETTTTDFLQSIGRITFLKTLWLDESGLSGTIHANTQGLCNLKHLEEFHINGNDLNGDLPQCFGNMTSLQVLDISDNRLRIPISLSPFFNLSKLTYLNVHNNTIHEDTEDHNMFPKFQLEELHMNGYSEGREIPKFLHHQHNLQYVSISSLKLRGRFPYWLLENNTRLDFLDLSNNSFSGPIQLPNRPHAKLTFFDISDNFFNGPIPSKIGILFPNLELLAMSGNELVGSIPDSLCYMSALSFLDLSNNNVSGILPSNISNSNFEMVNLSKNRLQGSLKDAFLYSRNMHQLDLSHNRFSGTIPSWIGEISELRFLVLGHNNLQGKIPTKLCNLKWLRFLDLSHNNITGHMIPCLNLTKFWSDSDIDYIEDIEMTMKGRTYMYQSTILQYVSGIDISRNNMTGNIPSEIGNLIEIQALNFSRNSFTGEIPPTFSNLKEIESLDLSFNNLQGMIPPQLTQLTSLAAFNVSYNNLSGPIPDAVKQFGTFSESSYKGNPFLCGLPLSRSCSSEDSPRPNARILPSSDNSRNRFIDMEDFFVSFGISYGTMLLTLIAILCINPYWRRVWFYHVQLSIDKTYYFIIDNVTSIFSKF